MDHCDLIGLGLNIGAGLSALLAAIFWFASAVAEAPQPDETWGGFAGVPTKIIESMKQSAKLNRWAALAAGVSALLMGLSILWGLRAASPMLER